MINMEIINTQGLVLVYKIISALLYQNLPVNKTIITGMENKSPSGIPLRIRVESFFS